MRKLLLGLALCCFMWPIGTAAASGNEELVVKRVSGDVQVGAFEGSELAPLETGARLKQIDSIQVGEGEAELALYNKTVLYLGPGSRMTVIELGVETTGFYISKGKVNVEYMPEPSKKLIFETAAGLAEPKGKAVFIIEATDDGAMEVSVHRGTVAAAGDKCSRDVKKGTAVLIDSESCSSRILEK